MDISSEVGHYLLVAKDLSLKSTHYKARIGAVIVDKQIVSFGTNQEKSHPLQKILNKRHRGFDDDDCHHYLHAELSAILKTPADLSKATMYIARTLKNGKIGMCRPCPACMAAIISSGIKTLYYTTDQGYCKEVIR